MRSLWHKKHGGGQPPATQPRRRRYVFCAFLLIAFLEVFLRPWFGNFGNLYVYDPAPTDGRCVALKANLRQPYTGWMLAVSETTMDSNAYAYRGLPHPPGAATDAIRIAVLGDSIIYGQGVEANQTMPAYLENMLTSARHNAHSVHVLNFGIPGLNFGDFAEQVTHHVLRWHPDLLLLSLFENDLFDPQCKSLETPAWLTTTVANSMTLRAGFILASLAVYIIMTRHDATALAKREQHLSRHLAAFTASLPTDLPLAIVALGDPITIQEAPEAQTHTSRVLDALGTPWLDARTWRNPEHASTQAPALSSIKFESHLSPDGNREFARRVAAWLARTYPELLTTPVPPAL